MNLLPKDALLKTSRIDHADWNYEPLLQHIARIRFGLILRLLPGRVARMLEVGFGSGVFLPELAGRTRELYGIDVHDHVSSVADRLTGYGVDAHLTRQGAEGTAFPDGFFDAIVAVSALEFIADIDPAAAEFRRILARGGRLYAVMPRVQRWLDFALRMATGEDARRDYGDRRERVRPALERHFRVVRRASAFSIYDAFEFEPREEPH